MSPAADPLPGGGPPVVGRSGVGDSALASQEVSLVDLLDRLLAGGVVLTGDLTLAIADVDLVRVSLHALITSIGPDRPAPWER